MKKIQNLINPSHAILSIILMLTLAIIACGSTPVQDNREIHLAQTEAVIILTQTALEQLATQTPIHPLPTLEPTKTASPEETLEASETPVTTHLADILFEGIRFSFNQAIASEVTPSHIPQEIIEDFPPEYTFPDHTQFTFEDYQVSEHYYTPIIRVFPVDAFTEIDESIPRFVESLQSAVNDCPTGGVYNPLPFLPRANAIQILSTKVSCFDFQNGVGLRYLVVCGQDATPVDNLNIIYTYQGITDDGQFYISAMLPITHPDLPDDARANVTNFAEAVEKWMDDYPDMVIMLDEQLNSSFSPSIDDLDEMMASFSIAQ